MEELPTTLQLKLTEGIFLKIIIANHVINSFLKGAFRKKSN